MKNHSPLRRRACGVLVTVLAVCFSTTLTLGSPLTTLSKSKLAGLLPNEPAELSTKTLSNLAALQDQQQFVDAATNAAAALEASAAKALNDPADEFNRIDNVVNRVSRNLALNLGYSVANLDTSVSQTFYLVRLMVYREVKAADHDPRAYVGFGFEMLLTVTGADLKGDVTLPFIAASSTLGTYSTQYEIKMRGFAGTTGLTFLNALMPQAGKFDVDNYSGYTDFRKALQAAITAKTLKVSPVFFDLALPLEENQQVSEAIILSYSLSCIARQVNIDGAIQAAPVKNNLVETRIRSVYLDYAGIKRGSSKPSQEAADKAAKYLASWKLQVTPS